MPRSVIYKITRDLPGFWERDSAKLNKHDPPWYVTPAGEQCAENEYSSHHPSGIRTNRAPILMGW